MAMEVSSSLDSHFKRLSVAESSTFNEHSSSYDPPKANPWKTTSSQPPPHLSDNGLLESDAWPEPSAPFERQHVVAQRTDEKPKNKKLKWQSIDIEPPESGTPSYRGRQSSFVNTTCQATFNSAPMNRRGASFGRARFREGQRGRFPNPFNSSLQHRRSPIDDHSDHGDSIVRVVSEDKNGSATSDSFEIPRNLAMSDESTNEISHFPGRSDDLRFESVSEGHQNRGAAGAAYSRSRRAIARGHSYIYQSLQKSPLVPVPALCPMTYFVPGVIPGCIRPPIINPSLPLNNSLPVLPLVTFVDVPSQSLSSGPSTDVAVNHNNNNSFSDCSESALITSQSIAMVSLDDMLNYIKNSKCKNVKIPTCLKNNHPIVMSSLQGQSVDDLEIKQSVEEEQHAKPDDVVVLDNSVFFVPRNVRLTKFLHFKSKHDYIRHHVEYYFSDANLHRDGHLISILGDNQQTCPLASLLQFNRLRWANVTNEELLEAIVNSSAVKIIYSEINEPVAVAPYSSISSRVQSGNKSDSVYAKDDCKCIQTTDVLSTIEASGDSVVSVFSSDLQDVTVPCCNESKDSSGKCEEDHKCSMSSSQLQSVSVGQCQSHQMLPLFIFPPNFYYLSSVLPYHDNLHMSKAGSPVRFCNNHPLGSQPYHVDSNDVSSFPTPNVPGQLIGSQPIYAPHVLAHPSYYQYGTKRPSVRPMCPPFLLRFWPPHSPAFHREF